MASPSKDPRRAADLATIHMAGKTLFGDVSANGTGRDDYENWLERHTGKRSAGALSTSQRIALIRLIRQDGIIPDRARGGTATTRQGADRPSKAQWAKLGALARSMGWEKGLEDSRLQAFATRTTKIELVRFLTRTQASQVITGLEKWAETQGMSKK